MESVLPPGRGCYPIGPGALRSHHAAGEKRETSFARLMLWSPSDHDMAWSGDSSEGDATMPTASPMPLDHDGARVAWQQSPILRRDGFSISTMSRGVKPNRPRRRRGETGAVGPSVRSGKPPRARESWPVIRDLQFVGWAVGRGLSVDRVRSATAMLLAQSGRARAEGSKIRGSAPSPPPFAALRQQHGSRASHAIDG